MCFFGPDCHQRESTALCVARGRNLFHVTLALESALDATRYWHYQDSLLVASPVVVATLMAASRQFNAERLARLPTEVWFHVFSFLVGPDCYPHIESLKYSLHS